ncbi:MAG: hypothetical protein GXO91_07455 [FCB group bacterium]|nr:hypothetical protein [FCB group bacterium]
MKKIILLLLTTSPVFLQTPIQFELARDSFSLEAASLSGLPSNSVVDVLAGEGDDILYFGTSGGLAYANILPDGTLDFQTFDPSVYDLPEGGNPGLAVQGSVVAVSGAVQEFATGEYHPAGSGIGYSLDGGVTWTYKPQYVAPHDSPTYIPFVWGGQELQQLAVTTEINNVSYDLAIQGDYIYAASWAGGLRRFKFQNYPPAPEGEDPNPWEAVALPMDNETVQYCGAIDPDTFELNPNDPPNGGYHNHKGFSVYSLGDTLWVGTAAGINKGIVSASGCIDWRHFNAQTDGFTGNWVIGFSHQDLIDGGGDAFTRLWAATWPTGGGETYGVTYTDDGGTTWNVPAQIEDLGLKVYSISTRDNFVYLASDTGLYFSADGEHWELYSRPVSADGFEVLTDVVYASADLWPLSLLVTGTPDGVAATQNNGLDWEVHRFWVPAQAAGDEQRFYAYPNPFYLNDVNVVGDAGHVRFVFYASGDSPQLQIFDFSMNTVRQFGDADFHYSADQGEVIWDGRNDWGDSAANGVYFCKLKQGGKSYWTKLLVIN